MFEKINIQQKTKKEQEVGNITDQLEEAGNVTDQPEEAGNVTDQLKNNR